MKTINNINFLLPESYISILVTNNNAHAQGFMIPLDPHSGEWQGCHLKLSSNNGSVMTQFGSWAKA